MGKGKLAKFADMAANPLVVQCPYDKDLVAGAFALQGRWCTDFFHNPNPITLELGCGRGEYTVGLARRFPQKNFIGVDIKGARMWHGAQEALHEGLPNAAFLRTRIEMLDRLFASDEVSELWLTFSDPQTKKPRKRLTHTTFLARYRQFLIDGGLIHLKTDSQFLHTYTRLVAEHNHLPIDVCEEDLYHSAAQQDSWLTDIQTYYEQMWIERGLPIRYIRMRLPHDGPLTEPDTEIPVDPYRSYGHQVNSPITMRK